jgi:hypothetical protein
VRRRKGDNIVREVNLDFVDAIKGVSIGTPYLKEISAWSEKQLAWPAGEISANLGQLQLDASHVEVQVRLSIVEEEL